MDETNKQNKYNAMAIVGFICAFILAPLGIIFSAIALNQIKKHNEDGKGLAVAGLVLGIVFTIPMFLVLLGAISYFGAVNPTVMVPEKCNVGAPFTCSLLQTSDDRYLMDIENTQERTVVNLEAESENCEFRDQTLKNGESSLLLCTYSEPTRHDRTSLTYAYEGSESFERTTRVEFNN